MLVYGYAQIFLYWIDMELIGRTLLNGQCGSMNNPNSNEKW
jgi:hypothetical protein